MSFMKHPLSECMDALLQHDFGHVRLHRPDARAPTVGYSLATPAHGEDSDNLAFSI
jgi:hypothetical protein